MHIKAATSYQNLKTVNGFVHNLFQEPCDALGLLKYDKEWDVAMSENAVYAMPRQLRKLFVHILSNNQVADLLKLWEKHWESMSEDILLTRRRIINNNELHLNQSDIHNFALAKIEKLFNDVGKSLKDYNSMPFPDDSFMHGLDNRLLSDELSYNKEHEHEEHDKLYKLLNKEQLHAYASIIDNVENGKGGIFFVYGSGGCGKTFMWNTLCCKLRSVGRVVLPIASSGIAATLLPGGRTAHSRFHIPLKVDEYSVAGIKHGTEIGELLKQTSLIIWDEAPMQHRHAAESVDRSLRDIMTSLDPERASLPFGGITIIFGGDFQQILPVIPKASRAQVVSASLNSSKIWDHCRVPGKEHSYFSQDSLVDSECDNNDLGSAFPIEYLNSINMPCLPKHHLKIKEGCMIMLMRNLNQIMGLCNGTIMIVKRCLPNSIVCVILTGSQVGTTHIIPRIEMEPSDTQWPFEFKRVQFPVQLCYAMTIIKSQGQSLHKVGLYLPRSVFTHGQLYVAVSRVTSPSGLHILIDSDSGGYTNVTSNVIFEEVFYNFPSKDNQNR
ncbi:uncharacterized protein LOC141706381 [Apium graveolens]|uniref:uncharacterized protein LOC141706381 n=1 Tax=Apium graveolens TaxID=4045 RepID=UPI003D7A1FC6